ncbi:hypothetical protein B0E46_13725 [Rhodanobacter sp. B04]|nr:hypothetical protein B0E46_13725 [Rhodanobacter sp. B04]
MHATSPGAWPRIKPLNVRIRIDLAAGLGDIRIPIRSINGETVYWLRCLSGTTAQLDTLGEHDGENYVAPLACVLVQQPDGWHSSLLGEDGSATWYSRGQFHGPELTGDCGRYPEFGLVRHFRLRGMQLTLAAENVKLNPQKSDGFSLTLHVSATQDAGAKTVIAERPGYLAPGPSSCRMIKRGFAPLMCRDEKTSSWGTCTAAWMHAMGYPESHNP